MFILAKKTPLFYSSYQIIRIFAVDKNIFLIKTFKTMKGLGYVGAFLGGALAGAAIGILIAPDKGSNTREKLSNTVDEFLKKHNIKLKRKVVGDLVDDLENLADE